MECKPVHTMEFHVTNKDVEINPIENPSYIYKVGDEFIYEDVYKDPAIKEKLLVTSVRHMVTNNIVTEQVWKILLEVVEE